MSEQNEREYADAEGFQRDYLCAVCWGHLILKNEPGRRFSVECAKYGKAHEGFVTRAFVEHQRSNSGGELAEARWNLAEILGLQGNETEDELLKDLGF
jgi:hypothetical protein